MTDKRNSTDPGEPKQREVSRRDTIVGLLRRPAIQAILAVSVVAQVVSVVSRSEGAEVLVDAEPAAELPADAVVLEPVTAEVDSALHRAWLRKAIERESERIAMEYRGKGYNVTPQLARQIAEAAAEFEIDPAIAFGLVRAESSFRTTATSPVGAVGLTQLMPRTAAWLEPGVTRSQLRDPETNLRLGFQYLRYLMDKYEGDEKLALLAYNRGPGTVDRALARGRNPDNGYADFVHGRENHGHRLFTR